MKNKITFVLALCLSIFTSCENEKDIQSDIQQLNQKRIELRKEVDVLYAMKDTKEKEIAFLDERLKELDIYNSGKTPKYILKIELSQSHITLDIDQHMKDAMNAVDFEMPVDRDFYNNVRVGTKITDDFRIGSFILSGSIGSWDMEVVGKEIR